MKNSNGKSMQIEKLVDDMIDDKIPNNSEIYLDLVTLSEVFTKKRMEMIKKIDETSPQSIQELSDKLKRKKQAVHRDLKLLEGHGIIEFTKKGKNVIPIISKELIYIPLKQERFSRMSSIRELVKDSKAKSKDSKIAHALSAEIYLGETNVNDMMKEVTG
jgi:predicted transcriptional regulator